MSLFLTAALYHAAGDQRYHGHRDFAWLNAEAATACAPGSSHRVGALGRPLARLRFCRVVLTSAVSARTLPRPRRGANGGESENAAPQPAMRRRLRALARQQLPVGVDFPGGRARSRRHPPLGCRDPATDIREGFGAANWTGLTVVNFLAIDAQPSYMKLHVPSVDAIRAACTASRTHDPCRPQGRRRTLKLPYNPRHESGLARAPCAGDRVCVRDVGP